MEALGCYSFEHLVIEKVYSFLKEHEAVVLRHGDVWYFVRRLPYKDIDQTMRKLDAYGLMQKTMFVTNNSNYIGIVVKRETKPEILVAQEKILPVFTKFSNELPITGVYVFGSSALAKPNPSDIDVLLTLNCSPIKVEEYGYYLADSEDVRRLLLETPPIDIFLVDTYSYRSRKPTYVVQLRAVRVNHDTVIVDVYADWVLNPSMNLESDYLNELNISYPVRLPIPIYEL